jgi:hypothetical protein
LITPIGRRVLKSGTLKKGQQLKALTLNLSSSSGEQTMNIQAGFMVFRIGKKGNKPRRIHVTVADAYKEASRLALKAVNEGSDDTFLVVEIVGGAHVVNGKVEPLVPVALEQDADKRS